MWLQLRHVRSAAVATLIAHIWSLMEFFDFSRLLESLRGLPSNMTVLAATGQGSATIAHLDKLRILSGSPQYRL